MKKYIIILGLMLLSITSGFAQFTLNVTVPAATTDTCFVGGGFNGWTMTPLHYVSTSLDGTTKLFSSSTLPATFAGNQNFYLYNATNSWASTSTPALSFYSVATGVTSQNVTVTAWKNAINYTFINVTVPSAVSECYFISDQVGWTLPTNAVKMTLKTTNTSTKVYSYDYRGSNSAHPFNGQFLAGLDGTTTNTYGQKTPAVNFTNPGTGNFLNFTVTEFKAIFAPVTTALQNASNDNALIKVVDNKIVAEGVVSNVSIFDVHGSLIQSVNTKGVFSSKTLNSGLYIIRVDNKAYKQVVN